jgi:hypothetical protein
MIQDLLNAASAGWASFDWSIAVALYFTYIVIDSLNSFWALSVTRLEPRRAASTSFLIYCLLAFGVINYTRNFLYIFPIALGAATGTYILVSYERRTPPKRHRNH